MSLYSRCPDWPFRAHPPSSMNSDLISEIKPSRNAPLLGFWYPACLSSEVAPGSLKGTVLLGLPILVCKTSQGTIAAMRDICPHRGMPRWGQMSRMAAIVPCDVLQTRIGRPNKTVPFRLPGATSLLRQAGYQKPKSGAFLLGLISVMRSLFIDEGGCARKGQSGHREYSDMGHATSSQSAPNNCSLHFSSLLVKGVADP